jgi:Domain of unknown function (DUF4270)
MKHKNIFWPAAFGAGLFAWVVFLGSCTQATTFGSELLEDQSAELTVTDTLTVRMTVEREDSILTSDRSSTTAYFLCGQIDDPFLGRSQAEIFTLFQPIQIADFSGARLDSAVMFLLYQGNATYGDTTKPQTLRVQRLTDRLNYKSDYYSNNNLQAGVEVGQTTFTPRPRTPIQSFNDTASAAKAPYLRIPLSRAYGQELLALDTNILRADTLVWERLTGLKITTQAASGNGAMLAFNLNNAGVSAGYSRIRLYYTVSDTVKRTFDFFFESSNKFNRFTHTRTGSPAQAAIGKVNPPRLYLQGMAGLKVKIEVPYANRLGNVAINKAELVLDASPLTGDDPFFRPVDQLVMTEINDLDGNLIFVDDVVNSVGPNLTGTFDLFGGYPRVVQEGNTTLQRYRFTLTDRFQALLRKPNVPIYINVYPQRLSAQRIILNGLSSTTFPAKLTVKYTQIK